MLRRLLAALLLAGLSVGQAAPCVATYIDASGNVCGKCSEIAHQPSESQWAVDHGDCHDCCVASTPCAGSDHEDPAIQHPDNTVGVLPKQDSQRFARWIGPELFQTLEDRLHGLAFIPDRARSPPLLSRISS